MSQIVVVCHGRQVDDHGRPQGPRCRERYWPPQHVQRRRRLTDLPGAAPFGPPEPDEVARMAEAKGWLITPWRACGCPDHEPQDLHGTCPSCRKPPREVVALVREVARRG